jgi:parallel beta-helix repeat protein
MRFKKSIAILTIFCMILCIGSVSGATHVIDGSNYSNYFDDNGNIKSSSGINDGDTLKIGDIHGTPDHLKTFIINKKLTITSNNPSNQITEGRFIFEAGSQGSTLNNIHLTSTGSLIPLQGIIYITNTNHISLENNYVFYDPKKAFTGFTVEVADSSNISMKSNKFMRTGGSTCLYMHGKNKNIDVISNYISSGNKTDQGGSVVRAEGENYNINSNTLVGSPSDVCWGIHFLASNSVVDGNDISGSSVGIKIESSSKNAIISNNKISDLDGYLGVTLTDVVGIDIMSEITSVVNNKINVVDNARYNTMGNPLIYYAMRGFSIPRNVDKIKDNEVNIPSSNDKASVVDQEQGDNLDYNGDRERFINNNNFHGAKFKPSDPNPDPTPEPDPTPGPDPSPGPTGPSSGSPTHSMLAGSFDTVNGASDGLGSEEQGKDQGASDSSEKQKTAHEITNSTSDSSGNDSPSLMSFFALIILILSLGTLGYMGHKKSRL